MRSRWPSRARSSRRSRSSTGWISAAYHYLHATRAELLRRLGRIDDARVAYERALALVHAEPERELLQGRLAELERAPG